MDTAMAIESPASSSHENPVAEYSQGFLEQLPEKVLESVIFVFSEHAAFCRFSETSSGLSARIMDICRQVNERRTREWYAAEASRNGPSPRPFGDS